jgi:hypothetical protein
MISDNQINNLKDGDKLIFFRDGGVLSAAVGNVLTFANWHFSKFQYGSSKQKKYWQCVELHNLGNHVHNFSIYDTELFDENIHKDFVLMDEKKIVENQQKFIKTYGS